MDARARRALQLKLAPNFEKMAMEAAHRVFDSRMQPLEARLAKIYRRLREALLSGRPTTRLDLDLSQHRRILLEQKRLCALCGYRFSSDDFIYTLDDDDEVYVADHIPCQSEVVLSKYYRRQS